MAAFEAPIEVESTSQPEWVMSTSSSIRTPPFAGQIDARLDRHDHARPQFFFAAGLAHGRQFMDFAADAVAQAMPEFFAKPGSSITSRATRSACTRGHARPQECDRRLLGLQHHFVDLFDLGR